MERFTHKSEPRTVIRRDLASRLREARIDRDNSPEQVGTRLGNAIREMKDAGTLIVSPLVMLFDEKGVDGLEEAVNGSISLSYQDCELLSKAYQMHRILIDPILSVPREGGCLVQYFNRFFSIGNETSEPYGLSANYSTPEERMTGAASASVVRLTLEPGGRSDTHSHIGDELLLVLKGSVDVLLLNSGLRARLNPGDFIHFHAEEDHRALNTSETTAELFIVRLRRSSRRAELINELHSRTPQKNFVQAALRDFHVAIDPGLLTKHRHRPPPDEVWDRVGLGKFLQLISHQDFRQEQGRLSLARLVDRSASVTDPISRARFDRIHHGRSPVSVSELPSLAEIYDISPMLLYDFVMPVVRPAIAVRCQPDGMNPPSVEDLRCLPAEFLSTPSNAYRIPCRRLADSNVAIAWLTLPPGTACPDNRHPGHEILVPFRGKPRLTISDLGREISTDEFAHFDSSTFHSVSNDGNEEAEVFVMRVYE